MLPVPADLTIGTTPAAHFGAGAVAKLPVVVTVAGGVSVLLVTDALLAATPVAGAVTGALAAAGQRRAPEPDHRRPGRRRRAGGRPARGPPGRRRRRWRLPDRRGQGGSRWLR
jgi:hypothetical protein